MLIYIISVFLISLVVAFFQYFYKVKSKPKVHTVLFLLKALGLFLLGLLLVNPKIKNIKTENIKPVLSVLVDNSLSTKHFKEENRVEKWLQEIKNNNKLNDKFNVQLYSFGKSVQTLDSLSFNESQTNVAKAIKLVNDLNKDQIATSILLSDGNQTIGNDYEFSTSKQSIFPVVIGDTTQYQDVRIAQLNVNKYSYIKNKFPVEILLFYDGNKSVNSIFTITQGNKKVFSEKVSFTKEQNTKTITANLTSAKEGLQYYTATISRITNEKNTKNNYKSFSVEVINEQTKVLILSSILHPDIGALKKSIESNKQRKVDIQLIKNFKNEIDDYQLVVFYQPNNYFKNLIRERKSNYLIISGTKTDWNFLNSQRLGVHKQVINQPESYGAIYNSKFLTYLQKNIRFNQFPPLKDKFGEVTITTEHQSLLYQKLTNIVTEQPLFSAIEKGENKLAVLFGEGIWKWRAASFIENQSFEDFDEFTGNLVQYLASTKKRNRLEVNAKRLYPANSNITITALYLDKNYKFDNRASLQVTITNTNTKAQKKLPLSLVNNSYQVDIEGLLAGDYTYKVNVNGQNINSFGRFKIENYQVEEQFTNANIEKLQKLATRTGGKLYYKNQEQELLQELIDSKKFYITQKSTVKEESLINWKWMLFLIVSLLSTEWFIRKYYGKV